VISAVLFAATASNTLAQPTRSEPTQVQRAISEDPRIDQNLVASFPASTRDDGGQQIAAVGPAMRPLVTEFNSIWPTRGESPRTLARSTDSRPAPQWPGHRRPQGTPVVAADAGEVLKRTGTAKGTAV